MHFVSQPAIAKMVSGIARGAASELADALHRLSRFIEHDNARHETACIARELELRAGSTRRPATWGDPPTDEQIEAHARNGGRWFFRQAPGEHPLTVYLERGAYPADTGLWLALDDDYMPVEV